MNHHLSQQIAKFFLRSSRGQGLISKFSDPVRDVLEGTVYLFALKGLMGWDFAGIAPWLLIGIVAAKKIVEVVIGWADEKLGFWKAENYYTAYELSPYNQEVLKILKNIEKKV